MEFYKDSIEELQNELDADFIAVYTGIQSIKNKLINYSDQKNLKGDEIVGWYGEICCRQLTKGKLVSDNYEYDVVTPQGFKISVKTRKGNNNGWKTTSAIPKIEINEESPTHLMFIHLLEDYSVDKIWLFNWIDLIHDNRFLVHKVRRNKRSYVFRINPEKDQKKLIYSSEK